MLHLVFQSPIDTKLLARTDDGDCLVFIENSVIWLLQHSSLAETLINMIKKNRLCVLADDLQTRGISNDTLIKGIEVIDYQELVNITIRNRLIQSWTV
jgi:tRNA 2-thiouridine synthesizing protein B